MLFVLLTSCASLKKSDNSSASKLTSISQQDITLFEEAFKNLGAKNYASVIPIFKKLAEKYQKLDLEWASLYNLASAYKELNQCENAETVYQSLIPKIKSQLHLKPRIYLSLSYVYECLGQKEETLIALKEGMQYINHLTKEIRLVEYPARLSLAYIRMDEDKIGLKIQKKVYENMEIIKKKFRISSAADENFSRYFYTIGRSHIRSDYIQLRSFLKMFFYYQAYLSQSLILTEGIWSVKAEKELGDLYRKMWQGLKKQKNKTIYQAQVRKILNQLKSIARSSKNKKIYTIYLVLRKKTNAILYG